MTKPVFFKLEFRKIDPKFPTTPEAQIHAKHDGIYQRMTYWMTEPEFDLNIDLLIKELEMIRKQGKRRFASEEKRLKKRPPA